MKEIVKYSNMVNGLRFKDFSAQDYDFLMLLCAKMKNQKTRSMTFDFSELKQLSNYQRNDKKAFIENLKSMNRKLMSVTTDIQVEEKHLQFVLFPTFVTDENEDTLTVSVNQDFQFVLNDLTANFTRFELEEFVSLDSKYAKTLYRLIKQYRKTGEYRVAVGELRDLMGCPPSYKNYVFLRDIINPSVKKLQKYFPLLKCTVMHYKKVGSPVKGYIFTFNKEGSENQLTVDQAVDELRTRKKPKQNSFNNFQQRQYSDDIYARLARVDLREAADDETQTDGQMTFDDYVSSATPAEVEPISGHKSNDDVTTRVYVWRAPENANGAKYVTVNSKGELIHAYGKLADISAFYKHIGGVELIRQLDKVYQAKPKTAI